MPISMLNRFVFWRPPAVAPARNVRRPLSRGASLLVALAVFCVLIGASAIPAMAETSPTRVLFICEAGTVKSAIAREIFRQHADKRGIRSVSFSRGIAPADHVSAQLHERLAADGIDTARDPLRKLSAEDLRQADLIVVFNTLPTRLAIRPVRDWTATPSVNDDYANARKDLDRRIDALLDEIEATQNHPG
jgi:protein-tyrosine-phosphatase